MTTLRPSAALLLLRRIATPAVGQTSQMTFTLPEGQYRAGVRTVEQYDRTRTFEGDLSVGVEARTTANHLGDRRRADSTLDLCLYDADHPVALVLWVRIDRDTASHLQGRREDPVIEGVVER